MTGLRAYLMHGFPLGRGHAGQRHRKDPVLLLQYVLPQQRSLVSSLIASEPEACDLDLGSVDLCSGPLVPRFTWYGSARLT